MLVLFAACASKSGSIIIIFLCSGNDAGSLEVASVDQYMLTGAPNQSGCFLAFTHQAASIGPNGTRACEEEFYITGGTIYQPASLTHHGRTRQDGEDRGFATFSFRFAGGLLLISHLCESRLFFNYTNHNLQPQYL